MASKVVEKKVKAQAYVTTLICEQDNVALKGTGKAMLLSNPPKYQYQCPVCGRREISEILYPMVTFQEVVE